jgi:hypothetical protein
MFYKLLGSYKPVFYTIARSAALTFAFMLPGTCFAINFGVAPKLSTLGPGIEASTGLSERLHFRLGVQGVRFSKTANSQSVKWQASLKLFSVSGVLDYHPFSNGFYCAAGLMHNGNRLNLSLTPQANTTINGHSYTPAQLGTAQARISFAKLAPYLGLGYDAAFGKQTGFSMQMDFGVLAQGSAKVSTSATGLLANNATLLDDLKANTQRVVNKTWIRFYPVVALGLKYTF